MKGIDRWVMFCALVLAFVAIAADHVRYRQSFDYAALESIDEDEGGGPCSMGMGHGEEEEEEEEWDEEDEEYEEYEEDEEDEL